MPIYQKQQLTFFPNEESETKSKIEIVDASISIGDVEYIDSILKKDRGYNPLVELGSGSYSTVFGFGDYAIKVLDDLNNDDKDLKDEKDFEVTDAKMLKKLKNFNCIPNLYAVINNNALIIDRVRGQTVKDFVKDYRAGKVRNYVHPNFRSYFEDALLSIVKANVMPSDVHNENVMIDYNTGLPIIVDVGLFFKSYGDFKTINDVRQVVSAKNAMEWVVDYLEDNLKEKL